MRKFVEHFTDKEVPNSIRVENDYFELLPEVEKASKKINREHITGLPLGRVKKGNFVPSIYLLEKLSNVSSNKVFITKKAEWLFLCGRDIFKEQITKDNSKGRIFLVQSVDDENLGYGTKDKHKNKFIIKNLLDRGDFLRRERSKN